MRCPRCDKEIRRIEKSTGTCRKCQIQIANNDVVGGRKQHGYTEVLR